MFLLVFLIPGRRSFQKLVLEKSSSWYQKDLQKKKRQTCKISGINGIALTKLDVLDELEEIKICIQYQLDGKKIDYFPAAVEDQIKVEPVYKTLKGWKTSTKGLREYKKLPENAQQYVKEIEHLTGVKIASISTSPEREDTILIKNPFSD